MGIQPKSLALFGVDTKDATVLASLITLLEQKMTHAWQINNSAPQPDRVLIDLDDSTGPEVWASYAAMGDRRIALFTGTPPQDAQSRLPKPIRARDLVQVLEEGVGATTLTAPISSTQNDVLIRLKRWPDPKLIAGNSEFTRLSAVLTRRTLTLHQAAQAAQTTLEKTESFVEACRNQGWLSNSPASESNAPSKHLPAEHPGLFSSIRAKLGI